ncbi:transposase [Micromonospora sp. NPDC047730]|uniref:transposase n=1 Tax=Micromonospora sp. NPDC047730 TaxID=3364253 RepID=UPI003720D26B
MRADEAPRARRWNRAISSTRHAEPASARYPSQFRRQAAALVLDSGRTIRDVGRELGVNHETPAQLGRAVAA